jgi:hypothetical protein
LRVELDLYRYHGVIIVCHIRAETHHPISCRFPGPRNSSHCSDRRYPSGW